MTIASIEYNYNANWYASKINVSNKKITYVQLRLLINYGNIYKITYIIILFVRIFIMTIQYTI